MSFDYFVAVHEQDWPTAASVQNALASLEYPLRLADAPPTPFAIADFKEGLAVEFEGKPVLLEAFIEQASDADDPESLYGYIAECAASNFDISNGDYFLTLTFRSDADQIRAGLYLAATMIKSFNGYGFENQAETHGGENFASQLIAEAADAVAFTAGDSQTPEIWLNPNFDGFGENQDVQLIQHNRSIFNRVMSAFRPK